MEQTSYGLNDLLAVMKRRKGQFLITLIALLVLTLIVTFGLPSVYRSTATILVEQEQIPTDVTTSSMTSYADQQIQVITQRVMTSDRLRSIIESNNLYEGKRGQLPSTELVEMAREDTTLEILSADVIDPRSGRPTKATIAFTLSFDHEQPGVAQRVANNLVTLYLNENTELRRTTARETATFLQKEAERLNREMLALEEQLAAFKRQYGDALPHLYNLNAQLMQRTETELLEVERRLRSLQDREIYLQAELAQISPEAPVVLPGGQRILPPAEQLQALRSQYTNMVAVYDANHPDVVRLRRQIDALEREVGQGTAAAGSAELEAARSELRAARERYTESHPEVQRLERLVATLEAEPPADVQSGSGRTAATNPAFIQLTAQLQAAQAERRSLLAKAEVLRQEVTDYQARLTQSPDVERDYSALTRDLDNLRTRYREVKAEQIAAEMAQEVVQDLKGQRFTLIEPPIAPLTPHSPNRLALLFLGLVLSLAGAIGVVAVAESMDSAVRGSDAVTAVMGVAPLAVIPYIGAEAAGGGADHGKLRMTVGLTAAGVLLVLVLVHFLYKPLDVLWFVAMRKLGI